MGWNIGKAFKNVVRETSKFSPISAAIQYANPKEYQTDYQRNAGARAATKAREAEQSQQGRDVLARDILAGNTTDNILSGTPQEQQGQLAGLNLGALGYGQGIKQIGQDIQGSKKRLEQRVAQSGGDPVSAALMGQKQAATASAQRMLAGSNVKGAAAAKAVDSISRKNAADVAASLYGQQRTSETDLRNMLGNMLSGTTSLMQGERAVNIPQPTVASSGGGLLSDIFGGLFS
jgi:hypothetical protein